MLAPALVAQKFAQPTVIPTRSWPIAVYTADFNEDGIPDLVYIDHAANGSTQLHVMLNDGHGNFTESYSAGDPFTSLAVGDLMGNGHVDIGYVLGADPRSGFTGLIVRIDAGLGNGLFVNHQATIPYANSLGHTFSFSAAGRLTQGGPLDLIAEDATTGTLFTFHASQTPASVGFGFPNGFTAHTGIQLPDGAGPVSVLDLNGDGNPELIVNGQTGFAANLFLGSANGIATNAVPSWRIAGLSGIHSLLLQDVNNDARPDLIAEGTNGRIDVFAGNGDGTFQASPSGGSGSLDGTTGVGGHLITLSDLNHDGLMDALTATPVGISTLVGDVAANFALKGIYNAGPGHAAYAVADFNRDGNLDLALDSPEGIAIIYGNADGSFQTSSSYAAGKPAMSGVVGAFTASGNLDAVVSTAPQQAQLLHGNGDGTFNYYGSPGAPIPTTTQTGPAGLWSVVQAADMNGDGHLDLVLTADGPAAFLPKTPDGMKAAIGVGDGTFAAPIPMPNLSGPTCPQSPGLNYGVSVIGNNLLGAAIVTRGYEGLLYEYGGNQYFPGGFQGQYTPATLGELCGPADHNLAITANFINPAISDLISQADGHLFLYLTYGKAGPLASPPDGDFAVDGSLTTPGQRVAPALSQTFGGTVATSAGGLGFPAFMGSGIAVDLDGDGNQDLIVTYANLAADRTAPVASAPNYVYIWFGSGGGKFLTSAKHPVNPVVFTPSRNFYQVAVADVSGDNIPDLILSDGYVLSVQTGKGDGTFGAETHYLAGQGLNTISVGDVDHNGAMDLIVANGGTVWSNPVANLDHAPAAQDVNTGGITVLLNHAVPVITPPIATLTGTVSATPEPSVFGGAFSLTATVAPPVGNNNPVTGSFTFSVDGIFAGSAVISGLSATVTVPANVYAGLTVGAHTLTAVYSGDVNWATATFSATHSVSLIPTTIGLLLCVDPPGSNFPCGNPISSTPLVSPITMYYGQSLDGVATESALNLTGTITFYSGPTIFCTLNANLQQGSQTCPPNSGIFPAGTTTVTVVYSGDSAYAASTSNPIVVTVLPDITTATVTSSLNPAALGQAVTFTASVQGNFSPGAGAVLFLDGATKIGTATLDNTGHATLTTSSLTVGTHPIRVAFPGSANYLSTTSAILNQVILLPSAAVPSVVTLSTTVNPSAPGQSVTFTATVTLTASFTVFPVGNVTFLDGSTVLGTGLVSALTGQATFTTSTLAVGSHPITASYPGLIGNGTTTATILASSSAVLTQVVGVPASPSFTLTVTPSPVTIGVGDTGILLVKVQALGGFSQQVKLTCSGLPQETTCVFVQAMIPVGGGSTTLQVAVSAPHSCDNNTPYFVSSTSEPGATAKVLLAGLFGGGLLFAGLRRRRRMLAGTIFLLLLSLGGFAMISGCGACTDLGTKPGVYSFTVVGTAQGSAEVESQKIPLTVTIP